jgi:hypothetical protein
MPAGVDVPRSLVFLAGGVADAVEGLEVCIGVKGRRIARPRIIFALLGIRVVEREAIDEIAIRRRNGQARVADELRFF